MVISHVCVVGFFVTYFVVKQLFIDVVDVYVYRSWPFWGVQRCGNEDEAWSLRFANIRAAMTRVVLCRHQP